jgi:hypothetical protein
MGDGGGGCWGGAKSCDAEKAWSCINHSILSEVVHVVNSSRSFEYNFDNAINIKTEDPKAQNISGFRSCSYILRDFPFNMYEYLARTKNMNIYVPSKVNVLSTVI